RSSVAPSVVRRRRRRRRHLGRGGGRGAGRGGRLRAVRRAWDRRPFGAGTGDAVDATPAGGEGEQERGAEDAVEGGVGHGRFYAGGGRVLTGSWDARDPVAGSMQQRVNSADPLIFSKMRTM